MRNSEFGMRNEPDLKKRTKAFALRILKLVDALPTTTAGRALASQILRSGTSVAANYRAACRAKSTADFIAKMGIVEEEADETLFWLELLEASALLIPHSAFRIRHSDELSSLFHRPANFRRRDQHCHHAGRGHCAFNTAHRAISRYRATNHPGHSQLSRRERESRIGNSCDADRAASQWRREHALHVLAKRQ